MRPDVVAAIAHARRELAAAKARKEAKPARDPVGEAVARAERERNTP